MRTWFLIIMIALLPFRGWAGEVMATEMASSQVVQAQKQIESAIQNIATSARIDWPKSTFNSENSVLSDQNLLADAKTPAMADCEGHAKVGDAEPASTHCDTCPACQACHTVALSTVGFNLSPTFSPRSQPGVTAADFASAITALGQKPPIS
jgi:hypothetical protein